MSSNEEFNNNGLKAFGRGLFFSIAFSMHLWLPFPLLPYSSDFGVRAWIERVKAAELNGVQEINSFLEVHDGISKV